VDTIIILTTYPDIIAAKKVAHSLINQKLAACVNLLPQMTSIYLWEGKIESGEELQLLIKTRRSLFSEVKNYILDHHPYELPEILCIPVLAGSEGYLNWIEKTTHVD
jgi:periplasmic divalent cation tolerance protein